MSKITYYVKKLALKPFWITEDGKANVTNPLHSGCYWWLHVICSGDPIPREQIRSLALSEGGLLCNEYRRVLWLGFLQIEHNESTRECDITEFRDYSQVSVCCVYVHYSTLYMYDLYLHLIYYNMWVCSFNLKLFHKRQMPSEICRQNFIVHCSWWNWYSPLQVCLDVHRCNSRIPKDSSPSQAAAIKSRLRNVIIKSLAEAPSRYYYQVWRHYFVTIVVLCCYHM